MKRPFLQLVEVTKWYADRCVVNRLSVDVIEGEIVALVGPSGCGKTTTLRLIAGLEGPEEGEIWIADKCVSATGQNHVPPNARCIGFVFQELALWPHLTVAGSLEFVLSSVGVSKREQKQRIEEVLRLVRIPTLGKRYPHELSGGEQQRAALARALVGKPRLLLLDEPMSNLDADLKAKLIEELALLQQSLNITTIYITHDRTEAMALAHRIALMREGRIVESIPGQR